MHSSIRQSLYGSQVYHYEVSVHQRATSSVIAGVSPHCVTVAEKRLPHHLSTIGPASVTLAQWCTSDGACIVPVQDTSPRGSTCLKDRWTPSGADLSRFIKPGLIIHHLEILFIKSANLRPEPAGTKGRASRAVRPHGGSCALRRPETMPLSSKS